MILEIGGILGTASTQLSECFVKYEAHKGPCQPFIRMLSRATEMLTEVTYEKVKVEADKFFAEQSEVEKTDGEGEPSQP